MDARSKVSLIVKNIGQLVTLAGFSYRPALHPVEETLGLIPGSKICVAAARNRISYVGDLAGLAETNDTSEAVEIDAQGSLVLPGFVDSHTHCVFSGSRENELSQKLNGVSYLEILSKGGGILRTVEQTRSASDEQIIRETTARLNRMLENGTTTFEIKTGYGLSLEQEIRLLNILEKIRTEDRYDIVPTLLSAHAIPNEFRGESDRYIREIVFPTIDVAREKELAVFVDAFAEEGVFSIDQCRSVLQYAQRQKFALKIHADEFSDLGGAKLAAELRATSADHLLRASDSGLELLANAGVISVLLPGTSLTSFAGGFAKARSVLASGGAVALGTDLSPNSWIESMQLVIYLACYGMRMTSAEALTGATINAAHAIGRAGDVGSIEIGKRCDLLVTNLKNYNEVPYKLGSNIVKTVIKNGKVSTGS